MLVIMATVVVIIALVVVIGASIYSRIQKQKNLLNAKRQIDIRRAEKIVRLNRRNVGWCSDRKANVKLFPYYNEYYVIIEQCTKGKSRVLACEDDNLIFEEYFNNDSIFIEHGDNPTLYTFRIRIEEGEKPKEEDVCVIFIPNEDMIWRKEKTRTKVRRQVIKDN